MKFGLYYTLQSVPPDRPPHSKIYRELLEQVEAADRLGYDSAWITEHHFLEHGICPSNTVICSAIAARTQSIRPATGVYLLPEHHPIRAAEEVAVIDNVSNGRFIFGIAPGYAPKEFEVFEKDHASRSKRMEEQIDICIKSWTTDSFSYAGKYYKYNNVSVTPKPVQRPYPPIWVGASTKGGLRRAAKRGFPLLGSPRHHISDLVEHYRVYNDYLKKYNQKQEIMPVIRKLYIAENQEKAEREARPGVEYRYKMYGAWGKTRLLKDDSGKRILSAEEVTFEGFKGRCILGSPDSAIKQIENFKEQLGMNYLICFTALPGIAHDKVMSSLKIFAKEVMPSFQ